MGGKSVMRKAVYGGSFDPITLGHLDLIERASKLVDVLVVTILENPRKNTLFSMEERKRHLEMVLKDMSNVEVATYEGLLVDFARSIEATIAIRGLRNAVDFASEYQMYLINRKLDENIETIFLASDEQHISLSSTNVKEVARFGGTIDFMVPMEIKPFVIEKIKK